MKKFLFTLAALFMMGTAYADNVVNMPDRNVTTELGTQITIRMDAEFDNYVSAIRVIFTGIPEGVTLDSFAWGNGAKITYLNAEGDEDTYRPSLMTNYEYVGGPLMLAASQEMAYLEDGTYGGVAHWAPGTHADFLRVKFTIASDFKGGTLTWTNEPSAGGWNNGENNNCPQGSFHTRSCEFTVDGGQDPVVAPEPTIGYDENGNVVATCEGHTTVLMLNGQEEANIVGQPYELVQTWEPQTLNFYAYTVAGAEEDENSAIVGPFVVEVPALQPTAAPAPVISLDDNGDVIATAEGHTVQLYLNGNPVDQPYELPAATWETQTLSFTAVTQPNAHETATESAEPFVVTIDPLQPQPATAPEIVVENGFVTAVAEGHQTVLMLDGQVVNQPYELPAAGEEDVTLHFSAYTIGGEHETNSATVTKDVVVEGTGPVNPLPVCERPECAYSITALETVTVTITNNEPGATVYWSYVDPVTGETVEGSFTGEQDQIIVDGVGQYTITCYAAMTGYQNSPDGGCFFTILPNDAPPTAIDELVNGKTVAGVRYFNMAGQEMQEANGMTIVVTTYTDGTTSAVKVMK